MAVALAALAVPFELRDGNIPNTITLAGLVAAIAFMVLRWRFALHTTGFVLTAFPGLVLWRRDWIGGGAFKLIVAVATMGGPTFAVGLWAALGFVFLSARVRGRAVVEVASSPWVCIGTSIAAGVTLLLGDMGPWL